MNILAHNYCNFCDAMSSTSAFYLTNQIARVMECRMDKYIAVLEHRKAWLHHGYLSIWPSLCYTHLCVLLGHTLLCEGQQTQEMAS